MILGCFESSFSSADIFERRVRAKLQQCYLRPRCNLMMNRVKMRMVFSMDVFLLTKCSNRLHRYLCDWSAVSCYSFSEVLNLGEAVQQLFFTIYFYY